MRYAIISDIHANEAALRSVLLDAADAHADRIVCLGDVLGYGPDPVSTLELVYRQVHICLAGNHDDAIANRCSTDDFTDFAAGAVKRQRRLLAQDGIDWLRRLPYTCELDGFACAHGDFSDPKRFNYVLDPEDALPSWQTRPEPLLFVGHTHKPGVFAVGDGGTPRLLEPATFTLEEGTRYLVNVGSVGYPRSGVCRSCYCIYDAEARTVFFRSLPFDLEGYTAKMHGKGLDEAPWVGDRVRERRRPEVRRAASFAKDGGRPRAVSRRPSPRPSGPLSAAPEPSASARRGARTRVPGFFLGAVVLALAGVYCTVRLANAVPAREAGRRKLAGIAVPAVPAPPGPDTPAPAPSAAGIVVRAEKSTVPAGGRIAFAAKLKRGSAPVWVRVRYEDGNGAPVGDGLWYQGVRASKRSPKGGLVAPEGATAVFVEILKPHSHDVCEVAELAVGPWKEAGK
ncbi:MAG: metallophosphoesterase family protein [Kiritimatiellia bacterium]